MALKPPAVSIVTPCHNAMPFLRAMLDSVAAQTRGDWEHIIVDDGSTDESTSIIESRMHVEPRLRLVRQAQGGVARARNAGYAACDPHSAYVYFLDADDLLEPEMLATIVGYLEAHPAVAVAFCDYRCIDEHGRPAPKDPQPRYVPARFGVRALPPDHPETPLVAVYSWAPVMESVSVIRRRAFDETPGWDPRIGQPGEGVDLFSQIALSHEIHFVNRTLYAYRRHSSQASQSLERLAQQDRKVQLKWRDRQDLTAEQRASVDSAQAFRAGRLLIHQHAAAARRYIARGELRHALKCWSEICRIATRRMRRLSPWPEGAA